MRHFYVPMVVYLHSTYAVRIYRLLGNNGGRINSGAVNLNEQARLRGGQPQGVLSVSVLPKDGTESPKGKPEIPVGSEAVLPVT